MNICHSGQLLSLSTMFSGLTYDVARPQLLLLQNNPLNRNATFCGVCFILLLFLLYVWYMYTSAYMPKHVYGCQRTALDSLFSFCTGFWVSKLGLQMCAANAFTHWAISALLILLYFFETGSCCIAEASLRCTVYLKVTSNSQSCFSLPCVGITDVYYHTEPRFIYSFKQTLEIFYFGSTVNNAAINIWA